MAVALGALTACSDSPVEMPDLSVVSVEVGPSERTLVVGDTLVVTAYPKTADGQILGSVAVAWASGNDQIAQVTPRGFISVIRAVAPGTVEVIAAAEGKHGKVTINVVASAPAAVNSVQIVGNGVVSLFTNDRQPLCVRAFAADGTELFGRNVSWTIANSGIASIGADGVVQARAVGNTDVTATVEGKVAHVAIDVRSRIDRIWMSPASLVLPPGESAKITATLRAADNATLQLPVRWTSSNELVATVDQQGNVQTKAPGTAVIKAISEGHEGWTDVRVVDWAVWNLALIGDDAPPATLFTRTVNDANGVPRTSTTTAHEGSLQMSLLGANSGRFQLSFHVTIATDQTSTSGGYLYGGNFQYDVQNTIIFTLYNGQTLMGRRFVDGSFVITGQLEPGLPEVTLTYRR